MIKGRTKSQAEVIVVTALHKGDQDKNTCAHGKGANNVLLRRSISGVKSQRKKAQKTYRTGHGDFE